MSSSANANCHKIIHFQIGQKIALKWKIFSCKKSHYDEFVKSFSIHFYDNTVYNEALEMLLGLPVPIIQSAKGDFFAPFLYDG